MFIIGIDPGISGAICFFENGKILDVIEMPTMNEGKKNKLGTKKREAKLTVSRALSDEIEAKERSLASVRRAREKEQKNLNKEENKENEECCFGKGGDKEESEADEVLEEGWAPVPLKETSEANCARDVKGMPTEEGIEGENVSTHSWNGIIQKRKK